MILAGTLLSPSFGEFGKKENQDSGFFTHPTIQFTVFSLIHFQYVPSFPAMADTDSFQNLVAAENKPGEINNRSFRPRENRAEQSLPSLEAAVHPFRARI